MSGAPPSQVQRERIIGFHARVELTALEITAGDDGLFRGMPEPVVLLGGYLIAGGKATLLDRTIARLKQPKDRFPTIVKPSAPAVLKMKGRAPEGSRVAVLAVALEEDGGDDVVRVYAQLGSGAGLRVWALDDAVPSVMSLAELGSIAVSQPPVSSRVGVLDDGVDLRDECKDDELVGAGLFLVSLTRQEDAFRLHFVSGDRKNDWTGIVGVSF